MSKKLHLLCNAHLDPVWQWEWEEGAAEALSTFRIAADFCEEYDRFVFCHNEALLYKWIEEFDPELFAHIQDLVKRGKWHIIGGWHLQPDCNMPSGEAFVRQIMTGREYFKEKFGVVPKVAFNADPFGHSRGLVQIMKKSGYEGYLFMRPSRRFLTLPANEFKWVGYDGSEITAIRMSGGYNSGRGRAAQKVLEMIDDCPENDFFLCLWGIGNHGGGPSKKDLDDLEVLIKEQAEKGVEVVHSTEEEYLKEVLEKRTLPEFSESLNPWAPGCYTTQIRVKQKYRLTENTYFLTESMCSHASSAGLMKYPNDKLAEAMYDILTVQFHDMLPGSSIQPAEEMCLRMLDHAIEILSRIKAQAFFALASGQEKAPEDRIPVFVYNPYPYEIKGDFVCEFMLWDQVWDEVYMKPDMYDEKGNICPTQCEKEYSTIPIEWSKRVTFNATLEPMKLNRFECAFTRVPKKPENQVVSTDTHFIFDNGNFKVEISKITGLVDSVIKEGTVFVKKGAFALEIWDDNFDPWYMEETAWKSKIGEFKLLSKDETTEYCHTFEPLESVHIIENGDVRLVVEAVFGYKTSRAVVKYIISNDGDLKIDVRINWNEKQKLVKLNVPSCFGANECIGEHPYGREVLKTGLEENVSQKYIALCSDKSAILAVNNGVYGSSFDDENESLKITLLRSPSYCAHPIGGRVVVPQDRSMPYIEQGERDYSFQFCFGEKSEILNNASRIAQHFNMAPMVLSFYPTGVGEIPESPVRIKDNDIINVTAFKKADLGEGYILRLFNPTENAQKATVCFEDSEISVEFGKFEIKTLRFENNGITETDLMEGLLN